MNTLELEKQLTLALEETPSDTTESTFDFYWMNRVSELLPELQRLRLMVIERDLATDRSWKQIGDGLGMVPSHVKDLWRREGTDEAGGPV